MNPFFDQGKIGEESGVVSMEPAPTIVQLKGRQDYLEIRLHDVTDFELIQKTMMKKLKSGGRFFIGTPKVVVIARLTQEERDAIEKMLKKQFLFTDVDFKDESIPIDINKPKEGRLVRQTENHTSSRSSKVFDLKKNENRFPSSAMQMTEGPSLFLRSTVRNGQRVEYDGHIIVQGDVNRGGELVATGNIFVMGVLRGKAHAGSAGNAEASVTALELVPQQLRIAAALAIPPEGDNALPMPEMATVGDGGEIVISPLMKPSKPKKRRFWQ